VCIHIIEIYLDLSKCVCLWIRVCVCIQRDFLHEGLRQERQRQHDMQERERERERESARAREDNEKAEGITESEREPATSVTTSSRPPDTPMLRPPDTPTSLFSPDKRPLVRSVSRTGLSPSRSLSSTDASYTTYGGEERGGEERGGRGKLAARVERVVSEFVNAPPVVLCRFQSRDECETLFDFHHKGESDAGMDWREGVGGGNGEVEVGGGEGRSEEEGEVEVDEWRRTRGARVRRSEVDRRREETMLQLVSQHLLARGTTWRWQVVRINIHTYVGTYVKKVRTYVYTYIRIYVYTYIRI
jgi:hypothetical protein